MPCNCQIISAIPSSDRFDILKALVTNSTSPSMVSLQSQSLLHNWLVPLPVSTCAVQVVEFILFLFLSFFMLLLCFWALSTFLSEH